MFAESNLQRKRDKQRRERERERDIGRVLVITFC